MTLNDEMGNLLPGGSHFSCQIDDLVGSGIKNVFGYLNTWSHLLPNIYTYSIF